MVFSQRTAFLSPAPSKGPTVRTKKVGKNEAVLEWDQLPVDVQNGFIRNYTIFYKTSAGNETGEERGLAEDPVLLRTAPRFISCCPSRGGGSLRRHRVRPGASGPVTAVREVVGGEIHSVPFDTFAVGRRPREQRPRAAD